MAAFFLPNLYHTLLLCRVTMGEGEGMTGDSWVWPGLCLVVSVP